MPSAAPSSTSKTFYRYDTADGRTVITDSLSDLPAAERARVERITLAPDHARAESVTTSKLAVDWPSFAAGFAAAAVLVAIGWAITRGSLRWLAFVLLAGGALLGASAYLGLLRRSTGLGTSALATPSAVIDDARRAVEQAKQRQSEQDRLIQQIQKEAR